MPISRNKLPDPDEPPKPEHEVLADFTQQLTIKNGLRTSKGQKGQPRVNKTPPMDLTLKKLDLFFDAFVACGGQVSKALEQVGLNRETFHAYRKANPEYEKRFQEAYDFSIQKWEDEVIRRGVEGVEKAVYYQGLEIGKVKEYSDSLLIFLLKGAKPEKYKERVENTNTNFDATLAMRIEQARKRSQDEKKEASDATGLGTE